MVKQIKHDFVRILTSRCAQTVLELCQKEQKLLELPPTTRLVMVAVHASKKRFLD